MVKANALVIGGGMITEEVVLPTVFQERRKGKFDKVLIASRRRSTVERLRSVFPDEPFDGYPAAGVEPEKSCPDAYKQALAALPRPGLVVVATPDHLHTAMTLDALRAGFHVIVQKPLCLKVAGAHEIDRLAKSVAGYVYTDYHKRHDPALRSVQFKYRRGEMGEALCGHAWIEERREMPLKWFARWCHESSPFEYIGVHYVDMFYYVTGLKPVRVIAFGQKKFLPRHDKDAYDAVQGVVTWENGAVQYVQTSWVLPDDNPNLTNQGFQITCTEGEFRGDNADRNSNFVTTSKGFERWNPHFFKPFLDWDHPERTEWRGYGGDSIIQGVDDVLALLAATDGLDEDKAKAVRTEMIARWEKTRPLPCQALIGTAVNEAVRLSLESGSAPVVFDDDFTPRLER